MILTHHNGAQQQAARRRPVTVHMYSLDRPQIKAEEIKGSQRQEVNLIRASSRKLKDEAKLHVPFYLEQKL